MGSVVQTVTRAGSYWSVFNKECLAYPLTQIFRPCVGVDIAGYNHGLVLIRSTYGVTNHVFVGSAVNPESGMMIGFGSYFSNHSRSGFRSFFFLIIY